MRLDLKDKRLITLLDKNARMPITEIAKRTRLNKDVVRYRMNKLEKEGVIKGYYALIDMHKLGYLTIRIYFDLVNINENLEKSFINFLAKEFNAGQIFRIDGEYQFGILIWEKSIYELESKLKNLRRNFGDNIERYNITIFTELHNYNRRHLSLETKNSELLLKRTDLVLKRTDLVEIDDLDKKILRDLSKNARITSVDLAEKLDAPQRTIFYRIRNLEKKKIILGYKINLDISSLDYENYFLEIYTGAKQNIKDIENFASSNKNCIGVDYVLHGADIEIETEFQNKKALLKFITKLRNVFKNIKKITYWSTLNYEQINFFP